MALWPDSLSWMAAVPSSLKERLHLKHFHVGSAMGALGTNRI